MLRRPPAVLVQRHGNGCFRRLRRYCQLRCYTAAPIARIASSAVCRNIPLTANVSRAPRSTRSLSILSSLPPMLVPPVVLIGLTVTLWLYKCAMMVVFQNKIIYMPSMPPFSRREKIATYEKVCWPIVWEEQRINSLDGVEIALCVGRNVAIMTGKEEKQVKGPEGEVVILYFQGNGSSIPPRLPQLSAVLKALDERPYTLIAVSYRGFWTSRGRASQRGIERDAVAALNWARKTYLRPDTRLVLWGQSIGAGVATFLAASHHRQHDCLRRSEPPALILETPFVSVRSMLLALYPQRWLPYRYLGPFLRNWWDSEEALRSISNTRPNGTGRRKVLVVSAEKDELVPSEQADAIEKLCTGGGMDVSRTRVRGALHTEATFRGDGRNAVVSFLKRL